MSNAELYQTTDVAREAFLKFCRQRVRGELQKVAFRLQQERSELERLEVAIKQLLPDTHIKKVRRQIGSHQTEVKSIAGRIRRLQELLTSYESVNGRYGEMFDRIHTIPRVKALWIHGNDLVITTDVLYGKHPDARTWHRFEAGRAFITIPPVPEKLGQQMWVSVIWKRISERKDYRRLKYVRIGGAQFEALAPQIPINTNACLGTQASKSISDDLRREDYFGVVCTVVRFAECFGQEAARNWTAVPLREVPGWYVEVFGA